MGQVKFNEPFRPVLLNLSVKLIDQLDREANALGWTRSDLVRHMLNRGLQEEGPARAPTQGWWLRQ